MPKPLSVLTATVALSACAALVIAQEPAPAAPQLAAVTPAEDANQAQPSERHPVYASETNRSSSKPTPTPTPTPAPKASAAPAQLPGGETAPTPTPKPQKQSWFSWLFGSHKKKATPTPTPAPTPAPVARKGVHKPSTTPTGTPEHASTPSAASKGKATPTVKKTDKPATTSKPEATPKPEQASATPKPEKVAPIVSEPTATPAARNKKGKVIAAPDASASNAAADAEAEAKEKQHFDAAKSKALADPNVVALKTKADEATTEDESKKALRAYNKALFEKIRKVDSSVSEYSERLEAAILKRLNE